MVLRGSVVPTWLAICRTAIPALLAAAALWSALQLLLTPEGPVLRRSRALCGLGFLLAAISAGVWRPLPSAIVGAAALLLLAGSMIVVYMNSLHNTTM